MLKRLEKEILKITVPKSNTKLETARVIGSQREFVHDNFQAAAFMEVCWLICFSSLVCYLCPNVHCKIKIGASWPVDDRILQVTYGGELMFISECLADHKEMRTSFSLLAGSQVAGSAVW